MLGKSLPWAVALLLALPVALNAQTKTEPDSLAPGASTPSTVTEAKLGSAKNVHKMDNLYFAGQFSPGDIAHLQANDIKRVVTLRTDGEVNWDEPAAVKAAGIKFIKVPFGAPEELTDDVFDKTRELFKDKSQTTLIHCGSANRVGSVWLPYRVLDEGVSIETALAEAKEIGLRAKSLEEKAIDYIKRKQVPAMANQRPNRASVDPKSIDP